jgi:ABC-type transport system involved in multi-copper enzyme maturation permease subunit
MYFARAAYAAALLLICWTAWLLLTGTQRVRDVGDLARFGTTLFQILATLQLVLALFLSALLAASAVAQEKDRKTLVLLLLTRLNNSELVLGRLLASLLNVLVMLAAALPVFMLAALLGGIAHAQIARVFAVTVATVLACGSLGSTLALWREKTFQALALTILILVLWLAAWSVVDLGVLGDEWLGMSCSHWAAGFSPWHAILAASRPVVPVVPGLGPLGTPVHLFLVVAVVIAALLSAVAVARVRVWNASAESWEGTREPEPRRQGAAPGQPAGAEANASAPEVAAAGGIPAHVDRHKTRNVWDNPVVWREICTWAYGRRTLVIKLIYLVLFGAAAASLYGMVALQDAVSTAEAIAALVALLFLSLVLVNAQAVTSLTSERDGRALDLLLVTELTPKEIVFGKLGGVFYNAKEMVVLPVLLCGYLRWQGILGTENLLLLLGGLAVLYAFVAMLGVHAGMHYTNSRYAIGASLGTVFFLFVGVATCIWMMIVFSGSFHAQFMPFFVLMVAGGIGLYIVLGARNPSTAIGVASFACPFATFYAITSYMLGSNIAAFLAMSFAYGFATVALLIPAIDEFDVATGRTTAEM